MSTATLTRSPALGRVRTRSHDNPPLPELDVLLEELVPGEAVFSTELRGTPQSEACTTLLELALAAAVQSVLAPGQGYRPVGAAVSRAWATTRPRRLEARARVVTTGTGTIVATGGVHDEDGRLVATGRLVARPA